MGNKKVSTGLPPILAVDFDGTIVEDKFPDLGPIIPSTIRLIHEYRKRGYKIILWTCRTKERLEEAVDFCSCLGIDFDAVNDNIPEVIAKYNDNARKIYADVYLDDKNLSLKEAIKDGEPCNHCLAHPGEVCGRREYRGKLRECKQAGSDILGRSYANIFWKSCNALLKKIFDLA